MEDLKDYSDKYITDLRYEDFSKEALIRLWRSASKLYLGIEGLWLTRISERYGKETAFELDTEIFKKNIPLEIKWVKEAMNISGDDVETLFKFFQCYAAGGGLLDIDLDLKNKNHGIYTVRRCTTLDYYERHADDEGLKHCCDMDIWGYALQAHCINPNIKTTCLKLPPRKSKDEIACQWEFRLER